MCNPIKWQWVFVYLAIIGAGPISRADGSPVPADPSPAPLPSPASVQVLPDSSVVLDGDSTLRKFSSKSTKISLFIQPDPQKQGLANPQNLVVQKFILTIPVTGLKSDNSTLDEHLQEALKADKYPDIQAQVKTYQIKDKSPEGFYPATASVEFTIAGASKVFPVDAHIVVSGNSARLQGTKRLLMTDFNIDPPTLMLGVIRVANEIDIHFDLSLAAEKSTQTSQVPRQTDNKGEK